MKTCNRCGKEKELSEFCRVTSYKDGLNCHCRQCAHVLHEKYKASQRNRFLMVHYGITQVQFDEMERQQNHRCAICGTGDPGNTGCSRFRRSVWHVDHDHQRKVVRGLLCHLCNRMLGLAKDNPEVLEKASEYLKEKSK